MAERRRTTTAALGDDLPGALAELAGRAREQAARLSDGAPITTLGGTMR